MEFQKVGGALIPGVVVGLDPLLMQPLLAMTKEECNHS